MLELWCKSEDEAMEAYAAHYADYRNGFVRHVGNMWRVCFWN